MKASSSQVLPSATSLDITDSRLSDAVQSRDSFESFAARDSHPNVSHIRRAQSACAISFADVISPLADHVFDVLVIRPEKQMRRVNAHPVVAAMAHLQIVWRLPIRELVRNAMRWMLPPAYAETPVAACTGSADPDPTAISSLADFFPKPIRNRTSWLFQYSAPSRTVFSASALEPSTRLRALERFAAMLAYQLKDCLHAVSIISTGGALCG